MVASLRDNYRRSRLERIVPAEQDARLIEKLKSEKNKSRFNLFLNNCADFSRGILNTYYPHATHLDF
jgi:hypothetical protein